LCLPKISSVRVERVGAENRVTLCDLLVFVDESAETIMPKDAKATVSLWS
jgi:hypothetical protein